jgi:hypothetical protein
MIVTEEQKAEAKAFYQQALDLLDQSGVPFMLGGAFAMFHYTGIYRDTKDLDVFCKASDYPKILKFFQDKGFRNPALRRTLVGQDIQWGILHRYHLGYRQ